MNVLLCSHWFSLTNVPFPLSISKTFHYLKQKLYPCRFPSSNPAPSPSLVPLYSLALWICLFLIPCINWNHMMFVLLCLSYLAWAFSRFIHVVASSISFCDWVIFHGMDIPYLFIHSSVGHLNCPTILQLEVMLLWTFVYKFLWKHKLSSLVYT